MAGIDLATQIFGYMDDVTRDFVASNVSSIIRTITPIVGLGLTIALMIDGLYTMIKPNGEPLSALMGKFIRWAIIVSIAGAGGWYQQSLANVAIKTPDEFSQVLILHSGNNPQQVSQVIDQALEKGIEIAREAFDHAGFLSGPGIASAFLAAMAIISTVLICGVGMALILMAKFMLAITVCFGPIFIFCLLFESVQNLFTKWIGSIINYSLITVLLTITFGLLMNFYIHAITAAAQPNASTSILVPVVACGLITVVAILVLKQIPEMAARWGDGVSANIGNWGLKPQGPPPPGMDKTGGGNVGSERSNSSSSSTSGPGPTGGGATAIPGGSGMMGYARGSQR